MSKETSAGHVCMCGQRIVFNEQHWPHCPVNPVNLKGRAKKVVESKFTKAELATIATHGPMRDEPVRKQRGPGKSAKSKSNARKGRS